MKKHDKKDLDIYATITACINDCETIDDLKVNFDLNSIKYDISNELNFLKWLYDVATDMWNTHRSSSYFKNSGVSDWRKFHSRRIAGNKLITKIETYCLHNLDKICSKRIMSEWLTTYMLEKCNLRKKTMKKFKIMLIEMYMRKHHKDLTVTLK